MRLRLRERAAAWTAFALLSICTASTGAADFQIGFPTSLRIEEDDGGTLKLRLNEDGQTLKVDAKGTFELNEDETDFERLTPGSYFKMETRRRGRTEHKYEVRGLTNGGIERLYRRRGKVMPIDAEGRAWLTEAIGQVVRNTSFAAEGHVARTYSRGGADAVLEELDRVRSDHTKRIYLRYLLQQPATDAATMQRIAAAAADDIGSDHELTELVLEIVDRSPGDERVKLACAEATKGIGSDHERRRALFGILRAGPASPELSAAVIRSADALGSDHERAETLIAVATTQSLEGPIVGPYFDAVAKTGSDHERKRTLVSTVARHTNDATRAGAVRAVVGMGSDYERANVLIAIADTGPIIPDLAPAYFDATRDIGSDHEQGRVLLNVLQRGPVASEPLRALIGCAKEIGSDARQADVLVEVARSQTLEEADVQLMQDAARELGSDYQRRRVDEALADRRL